MCGSTNKDKRTVLFKRNSHLERLLISLNDQLSLVEGQSLAIRNDFGPDFPLIFIMGPLRSGTTLFTQWLANTDFIAYPTNLLSRFYGAPAIGAQIQLLLTDQRFNFRDELIEFNNRIAFDSENGKTRGVLSPNEFWYFWRRFLPFQDLDLDWLPDEELFEVVDKEMLNNELTTLTRIFGKPFALKAMILNYNIHFLDAVFEKAVFVQIKRDPVTNVASILEARKRQLGSENEWYSFKIPEYPRLKNLDPISQATGQVHYINAAVTKGMAKVAEARKMTVNYEEFCQNPSRVFTELSQKLGLAGDDCKYSGPEQFRQTREASTVENKKLIEQSLAQFATL
ncbi:Sulfotransferase family protein [Candidatus Electrothrix laxa]